MTSRVTLRVWPAVALVALALLGLAVGPGSTPVDDWFQALGHTSLRHLVLLTSAAGSAAVMVVGAAVACYRRRWRWAAATVVAPLLAMAVSRALKPVFGREKGGALAYPSGHTTLFVAALAMSVLAVGATVWALVAATAAVVFAVLGQAVTYHYFTDAIGGVLLASAVVCLSVLLIDRGHS